MPAELDGLSAYDWAVQVPVLLVVVTTLLEVAWLMWRRPGDRRRVGLDLRTAGAMAAGAAVVGVAYTAVLQSVWTVLEPASASWSAPPVVTAAVAFVAWDLAGWTYHWLGHHTAIGWAAHRPHHTGTAFDLTLGLRQTWLPVHGIVVHPLLALAGFDLRTVAVCAAISNLWQALEHSSVTIRFPALVRAVVMTPGAHRHHHGLDGGRVNLGPVFTAWDRLAGTWVPAAVPAPVRYGVEGSDGTGILEVELAGWHALAGARRSWRRQPLPVASTV